MTATERRVSGRGPILVAVAVIVAAIVALGTLGAHEAAQQQRVLASLDVPIQFIRAGGDVLIAWSVGHALQIGEGIAALGLLLLIAWRRGQAGTASLILLVAALALASFAQACLYRGLISYGVSLYALAAACTFALGVVRPMPARPMQVPGTPRSRRAECALVVGLTLIALLSRAYALTELPNEYETEMIISMLSSSTWAGVNAYVPWGLISNTNGFVHVYLQLLSYTLLGTSFFSLRFCAVVMGTLTVPIFYLLLRRIAGFRTAVLGALLLITAPDQLFWSRDENFGLTLMAILSITTVMLGLRLVERPTPLRALAVAVWIPFTRWFYSPAIVLPFYLVLTYLHAFLFVPRTRRSALYTVPIFALGFGAWLFSLSFAYSFISGETRYIDPTSSGGKHVWEGEGGAGNLSAPELVIKQAANLANNLETLAAGMTYRTVFTSWYRRNDSSPYPTLINVGVSMLMVLGIGYLLAQIYDARAFAILAWVGIGILPGVMSLDPAPRRMALAYPGFYAIAALMCSAGFDVLRRHPRRWVARVASTVAAIALALVLWTSMASHFLMPISTTTADTMARPSAPVFKESDVIFHDLVPDWALLMTFMHSSDIFKGDAVPCIHTVGPEEWLSVALNLTCNYEDVPLRSTLSPEHRDRLRANYNPQRISFLIPDIPANAAHLALLRRLFPGAKESRLPINPSAGDWIWLKVDRASVDALRQPVLYADASDADHAGIANHLIADVNLKSIPSPESDGARVEGGLLLEYEGWYDFKIEPPCAPASLTVDDQPAASGSAIALTRGAHRAVLKLSSLSSCSLPLTVTANLNQGVGKAQIALTPMWIAPSVLAVAEARARPVSLDPGYVEAAIPPSWNRTMFGFAIDDQGVLTSLTQEGNDFHIHRSASDGHEEANWVLPNGRPTGMSGAPDGTLFILYDRRVEAYSPTGALLSNWPDDAPVRTASFGYLADGTILSALDDRDAIALLDRKGQVINTWKEYQGGPGVFHSPAAAAVSKTGDVVVIQVDGVALVFHTPLDRFEPVFQRSFRVEFHDPMVMPRGWSLGADRILVPDLGWARTLIYRLDGERVMARDANTDFSAKAPDELLQITSTKDGVYVLGGSHILRRLMARQPSS